MDFGPGDILQGVGLAANIFGSGKEKVNTTPTGGYATLPQYLKDAYEKVYYPAVEKQFNKPFQTEPMVRYTEQDPLFRSQAVGNYQALSDEIGGLFPAFQAPTHLQQKPEQAAMEDVSTIPDNAMLESAVMAQYAMLPESRKQQALSTLQRVKGKAGQTNKYSGETTDYSQWLQGQLKMGNSGAGESLFSQANPDYQAGLMQQAPSYHAATYDPTDSWLSALAPMIAGTLIGAPFMANPAMGGLLSKAIGQGGSMLARGVK